jgi:hypothetical protein
MKIKIIYLIILLSNFVGFSQGKDFKTFTIDLFYGDESINFYQLKTFKKGTKFYVESKNFARTSKLENDSIWILKLSNRKKKLCVDFIENLKSINIDNCDPISSAIADYTVKLTDTTIALHTYCHKDKLDFFEFRKSLFKEKIQEYKLKSDNEIKLIKKMLKGKWFYPNLLKPLKFGDTLKLSRKEINPTQFWIFDKKDSFQDSSNQIFNLKKSNSFKVIFYYEPRLNINPGVIEDKDDGSISLVNYGMKFTILKITEEDLILISLN